MSHNNDFNKENIETYLNDFAKEYTRLINKKNPLKIILVGGASVLLNYNFRKATNDIDYSNPKSEFIDNAVEKTAKKHGLFANWLNNEFRKTASYSDKLTDISVFYKKISNMVEIRTVGPEYLIAMKLMAFRDHKHDLSDIAGILMENKENNKPLKKENVENAIITLYGDINKLPKNAILLLNNIFKKDDYKRDYVFYKNKEDAVRKQYKKLKKENFRDIELLDHNTLLSKAIKITNEDFKKYDDNNRKEFGKK
jgi:hypothetical protein